MYNKIFTKILDSSIWLEPTSTRIVWITLIAAMDQDGYAHFSAIENLALRAQVSLDETRKAVKILTSPDSNSADPDHDGRRIERIPGGFLILNAAKHRDLVTRVVQREQTRKRVAKHRAKGKEEKHAKIEKIFACECCKEPFEKPHQLYVTQDHNHQTGEARGFICQSCNKIVGLIEANTPTQSKKADLCREYILRYVTSCNKTYGSVTPSEAVTYTDNIYTQNFEDIWKIYPKRAGSNPKKAAFKAWKARPDTDATKHEGAAKYANFCRETGKIGTEYVMQAKKFFGPDQHYLENWAIPTVKEKIKQPWQMTDMEIADECKALGIKTYGKQNKQLHAEILSKRKPGSGG